MAQFQDNQPTLSLYLASLLMCNLHLVNSSSIKDSSRNSFRVNLNNFRGSLNFRVNHNNSKGNNSTKDNLSNRDNLLGNHNLDSRSRNQVNLDHQSPCRPRSNLDLVNLFLCRPSRVKLNLETYLEVNVMVIVYTTLLGLVAFKSQIQS